MSTLTLLGYLTPAAIGIVGGIIWARGLPYLGGTILFVALVFAVIGAGL